MEKLTKPRIIEALAGWNLWGRPLKTGIDRGSTAEAQRFLSSGKVLALFGVRRSGKSFIMRQLMKGAADAGAGAERTLMINLEEPAFEGCSLADLGRIWDAYLEIIGPKGRPFLFLDEVQNVTGWERFVRALQEKDEAYVTVSGSSARLLSEELSTVLAGRQFLFEVFPLGFGELLGFRGIKAGNDKQIALGAQAIRRIFGEYFKWGGFPEIVLARDDEFRARTIRGYYEDILVKDMIGRYRIAKVDTLRSLARFYLSNMAAPVTFRSVSRFTGENVETARRYTEYLRSSRALFFVKRFSFSVKEQEKSPRKVYAIDHYLSAVVGFRFSEQRGKALENIVAVELLRRQAADPSLEFYYWNGAASGEVDFVIKKGTDVSELLQVCADPSDAVAADRERRSLLKAMNVFGLRRGTVLTEDQEDESRVGNQRILHIPAWRWLLGTR
jgi:hypothetical protein